MFYRTYWRLRPWLALLVLVPAALALVGCGGSSGAATGGGGGGGGGWG